MSDDMNERNQLIRYAIIVLNKLTKTTAANVNLLDSRILSISDPNICFAINTKCGVVNNIKSMTIVEK